MLCSLDVQMNRKTLALTIALLLTGLAPATAIIGFCAQMPCCHHASAHQIQLTTERADCCTTIACYESPSAKLATTASASLSLIALPALVVSAPLLPTATSSPLETPPPRPPGHRLALLSILLI
jgi:uncharacterized membrane protein